MRKAIMLCAFVFLAVFANAQTATVSGTIQDPSTSTNSVVQLRFTLGGCAGNAPRVNGTALITGEFDGADVSKTFTASSGAVSGTIVRSDYITCGSSTSSNYWAMRVVLNGVAGPACNVRITSSTFDATTPNCLNQNPTTSLSNLSSLIYALLDGTNTPFTGPISAPAIASIRIVDGTTYARTSTGIQQALDALSSSAGGYVYLTCGNYTISATITITGQNKHLVGCGQSTSSSVGTRLIAGSGSVTPMISWTGTSVNARNSFGSIENMEIEGVYTASQNCLYIQYVNLARIQNVNFFNCGQAEYIAFASTLMHSYVDYSLSGSGSTAATAAVRVSGFDASNPSNSIRWSHSEWLGDESLAGHQGVGIYFEAFTAQIFMEHSLFDYVATSMAAPLIVIDGTDDFHSTADSFASNGSGNTNANGTIYVKGSSGDRATKLTFTGDYCSWQTVTCLSVDYGQGVSWTGGRFEGPGSGLYGATTTANALNVFVFSQVYSNDNLASISSGTGGQMQLTASGGIAVGGTPATSRILRLPNNDCIAFRNAANSANVDFGCVDGSNNVSLNGTNASQFFRYRATLTTTAATSDNVSITGATSSSFCLLTPTNSSAATNIATTYISAKTTNQITVTHTATASMTYDIGCTGN